jgi:hypothetical protein
MIKGSEAPFGTGQKIRNRAIWSVALFAASVVPAIIGVGIINATADQANIATPFAFGLWAIGALFAIAAAVPTLRHWDVLPQQTRWLGALPMLCVSLFLSTALIAAAFVRP